MIFASTRILALNNKVKSAMLYMHEHDTFNPFSEYGNYFIIVVKHVLPVAYLIINTILLEYPYHTNCFNYKSSRQNCIEACIQHEARQMFNVTMKLLVREDDDTLQPGTNTLDMIERFGRKCSQTVCSMH